MDEGPRSERLRLRFVTRPRRTCSERFDYESGGFNDFGLPRSPRISTSAADSSEPLRDAQAGVMFVERVADAVPLGTISYRTVRYGPNDESSAWQLGIDLLADSRGQGYGTEAQRLLADWLLDTTNYNRVEAETDVDNVAEARSLEKAGFTREGVLRGAQFRAGGFHLAVYSRLRSDPR